MGYLFCIGLRSRVVLIPVENKKLSGAIGGQQLICLAKSIGTAVRNSMSIANISANRMEEKHD